MSSLLLAVLLLGDAPPAPAASPQPAASDKKRGDKAAEARARRTPAKKKAPPSKVLTNEDLEKSREGDAAVSVLAADGVEPAPVDAGSEDTRPVVAEENPEQTAWRRRAEAARTWIQNTTATIEEAELRLAQLRDNLRPGDPMSPNLEQAREAEIKAEMERLAEARAALETARQSLSDLEEEARKAGIPPGWLNTP